MTINALTNAASSRLPAGENLSHEYVTMTLDGQLFGVPVLQIQDVLSPQRITPVPLAPKEVVGSLNLRGRIVTAIDMRIRLGLTPRAENQSSMSVVAQHEGDLYSLIVDHVGDVMSLSVADYENNPATLPAAWRDVSRGIYRLENRLLIALDVGRVLRIEGGRNS